MIEQGVVNYLRGAHSGALLISGAWGSGKSYYVKNSLIEKIREIEYNHPDIVNSLSDQVVKILHEAGNDLCKHFQPVMVSVFGMGSIAEIERAVVEEWTDKITHGLGKKAIRLTKSFEKIWNNSKKLKDIFDVSSVLRARPSLSSLPKNVVIILDDLERFEDKISETEMLGFVNNLVENLGFKVLLIANEKFLTKAHEKHSNFKEKVIGKTLLFKSDILNTSNRIIREFDDAEFSEFMSRQKIQDSLDLNSRFSRKYEKYAEKLENLRTIKSAISHFHFVFKVFKKYADENSSGLQEYEEVLLHAWFSILAISLEFKSNHILTNDLRGLDTYSYLNYASIDLGDENNGTDVELFTPDNPDEMGLRQEEREEKANKDAKYASYFYQQYMLAREIGLEPIASPILLKYVVQGFDVDPGMLIVEYNGGKENLHPEENRADKELSEMMRNFVNFGNEDFVERLGRMLVFAEDGSFGSITGFVQASVYIFGFAPQLLNKTEESLIKSLEYGIDKWVLNHECHDIYRLHLSAMTGSIEGDGPKMILKYALDSLAKKEKERHTDAVKSLVDSFSTDIRRVCAELCPRAFFSNAGNGVGFFEMNPILHQIPEIAIRKAMKDITISDASALATLFNHRYSIDSFSSLKPTELPFWKIVYDEIGKYEDSDMTAGQIQARRTLYVPLSKFLEIDKINQE